MDYEYYLFRDIHVRTRKIGIYLYFSFQLPKTKIGIGLHAGEIVTGNVGTSERKQYSITGNTVILASRIEQLNKKFNSEILISKEVLDKLENGLKHCFRQRGKSQLKLQEAEQ